MPQVRPPAPACCGSVPGPKTTGAAPRSHLLNPQKSGFGGLRHSTESIGSPGQRGAATDIMKSHSPRALLTTRCLLILAMIGCKNTV